MSHNHLVNISTLRRKREIKNYKAPTLRKREINNYKEPALRLEAIFTLMLNWSTTSAIFITQHKGGGGAASLAPEHHRTEYSCF